MLWENVKIEKWYHRCDSFIFVLRRMLLIAIVIKFYKTSGLQMVFLLYLNSAVFLYVSVLQPSTDTRLRKQNIVHEFVVLTMSVQLTLFTDFCPDPVYRYKLGWGYISTFILFFVIDTIINLKS